MLPAMNRKDEAIRQSSAHRAQPTTSSKDRLAELGAGPAVRARSASRVCISGCGSARRSSIATSGDRARSLSPRLRGPRARSSSRRSATLPARPAPHPTRAARIRPVPRVEAAVPQAVGRQSAPVASSAERRRRRRDDPEDGAVRGRKRSAGAVVCSRIGWIGPQAFRAPRACPRVTTCLSDQCVAPPTSVLDEAHLGVHALAELDQRHETVLVHAAGRRSRSLGC